MKDFSVAAKDIRWLTDAAFPTKKRKVRIVVTDNVSFYNTFWDGGSKNTYKAVRLQDGNTAALETGSSPWNSIAEGKTVALESGYCIVEETVFCGKIMSLTVYLHPSNMIASLESKLIPID